MQPMVVALPSKGGVTRAQGEPDPMNPMTAARYCQGQAAHRGPRAYYETQTLSLSG